ncbi:BH2711 [Halalkalibacterium halodurans C-125]|uniref:BH2711 protein n=1 Tax=Halalkalibacterium halodurans (strain ATCC BAA-125 / DSM 18197 / FERM 7344 / JCM 9153 / C-125) TaxID=272558 RepID=Q9K9D7_HALH5|nr:BH2711 [Halalkalibacterium halodurans C-125]
MIQKRFSKPMIVK